MQSNNDHCAVNRKIKGRLRRVKKHVKKDTQNHCSNQDLDLETPNSALVHADLKLLINQQTFSSLSSDRQACVMRLLPVCDQVLGSEKNIRLAEALNNEFFTKACNDWKLKLSEGEFTPESRALANMENQKELSRIDPWKLKHYEPFWVDDAQGCKPFTGNDYSLSPYNELENQSSPDSSSVVTFDVLPTCDDDMPSVITSNAVPTCDVATSHVTYNSLPTCDDATSHVTNNTLPTCDVATSHVTSNALPTCDVVTPFETSIALPTYDFMTSLVNSNSLPTHDDVSSLITSKAFSTIPQTSMNDDSLVSTCNGLPSMSVETSRILSALLSSLKNPGMLVSAGVSAPSCAPSLSSDSLPLSSQAYALKLSCSEMNLAVTSGKLPGIFSSNGISFTSPPSVRSQSSPTCHLPAPVHRSTVPLTPVVFLPMPFLKSGSVPVLSNLPLQAVKSSSLPLVNHSSNSVGKGENVLPSLPPSSMRPSVFQIRVPVLGEPTDSDGMRKRLLDSLSKSASTPPEAKRPLLSLPTFPLVTASGIDALGSGTGTSSNVPLRARLVPLSASSLPSTSSTSEATVKSQPSLSTMTSACTTTLFSIPIQGMTGRAPCPVMFMVPAAAPNSNTTLPRPPASSALFYMINSSRPSFSSVTSGNPPVAAYEEANKSQPNLRLSSLRLPHFNGAGLATSVTNSNVSILLNGVRMVQPNRDQRPLYMVSLPSAAPSLVSVSSLSVSHPCPSVIRTESVRMMPNQVCSSLPQQLVPVPKSDASSIRFFPRVPISSSQPPQFVERLIAESLASRASSMFTTGISPSFRASIPSSVIGPHSTAASLPSFQRQVNSAVLVPPRLSNNATSSILQNLLSQSVSPSLESISRSLSHLYNVGSSSSSTSSVARPAIRLPNAEGAKINGLSRLSVTDASSGDGNKCGKCGAPCLLADRVGQYKLCITCLIMA